MRILRFLSGEKATWAMAEGETLVPLSGAPWETGGRSVPSGPAVPRCFCRRRHVRARRHGARSPENGRVTVGVAAES